MAPEQIRGAARVDERADIYALGAVAFRALSGRLPFEGSSSGMIMALKVDRPAPTLSEVTEEQWPAGIERFLAKALQRDRDQRFASASEALTEWRAIQPLAATMALRMPRPRPSMPIEEHPPERTAVDGPPTMTEASMTAAWEDGSHTEIDGGLEPSKEKEG
jgi:serine/threonine-protein kinase